MSVLISSGETSTDIEIVPVNRRILVDEDLYIDIDPGLIPVDINIDPFRANTRIIAIPSPIRARVKYFSRIVENPVYESPNFYLYAAK